MTEIVGVSEAASLREPRLASQSPLWIDILDHVESQISGRRQVKGAGPASLGGTASALARAHSQFLVALESGSRPGPDTITDAATEAVELLISVARVWGTFGARVEDRRAWLADRLRRRLAGHEDAVLAGEITYCVSPEHGEQPAAAMRQALASLSRESTARQADLLSISIAAVDVASLLVRVAANAAASGHGGDAPERRSVALDAKLGAIIAELAARSRKVERPAEERGDVVAHHLAAGLRVRPSHGALKRVSAGVPDAAADPADLECLRGAWLELATHEHVAVAALDRQLDTPLFDQSSGSLSSVIIEGAVNVIRGARLLSRPEAFRHTRAWRHQTMALTYTLEAYVAGLRGDAASLAQAQLIALTRVVRATVAIALIDLRRESLSGRALTVGV